MDSLKLISILIFVSLIAGFLMYKTKWKDYNIDTQDYLPQHMASTNDLALDNQQNDYFDKISMDILSNTDNEIHSSYRDTENLRDMLLNNHLNASDLVKTSHLIPKDLNFTNLPGTSANLPTVNFTKSNKEQNILKIMDTNTTQSHSKISDKATFTNLPNFFGNLRNNKANDTDNWHSYHP